MFILAMNDFEFLAVTFRYVYGFLYFVFQPFDVISDIAYCIFMQNNSSKQKSSFTLLAYSIMSMIKLKCW